MGIKEKIEEYQRQQLKRAELEEERAREVFLKFGQEKIPPLIDALSSTNTLELLHQIRHDEWRLGKVRLFPKKITAVTPIAAELKLTAIWPVVDGGYVEDRGFESTPEYVPREVTVHKEYIRVRTIWDFGLELRLYDERPYRWPPQPSTLMEIVERARENEHAAKILIIGDYSMEWGFYTSGSGIHLEAPMDDSSLSQKIETFLIEASLDRRNSSQPTPYDRYKIMGEEAAIQAIRKGLDRPLPHEFRYLLKRV